MAKAHTILVVDDEPEIRRLAVEMLTERGYRAISAGEPAQALNLLTLEPVDLLITDVLMPKMNGFDLAASARQVRPGIKVLYISGYAQRIVKRIAEVAAPMLQKPYRMQQLLDAVERCLAK